jgi:LuxR family maltose regulon positive regulatory protein
MQKRDDWAPMDSAGSTGAQGSALVVAAKLVVPAARPETIVRDRVVMSLDEASARPLTVVCAAAGYGKTTAVVTWLATVDAGRGWVSLDELDNDPRRLCAHLLAAIEGAVPGAMTDARQALTGGSDLREVVVPLVVGALAERVDGRLVVVLDDYHLIEHESGHALVAAFLDALPSTVRVIVSSRTIPPLRVVRRRALGTVAELGSRELAFQDGESERLLNGSLGLGLDPGVVEAIQTRVEGWPAGLALVASSLSRRSDRLGYLRGLAERHPDVTGTDVADYLLEEVLEPVEPRLREFLTRTSILGRFCGPLCAAVLEDRDAHELLAEVRRSNLFVTGLGTDRHGEWLRYHHLFAELLERELRASAPELVAVLHSRACEWFADNDLAQEAIAHATAAGDGRRAAALLLDSFPELAVQRRWVTLHRTIEQLPPDRGEFAAFCELLDAATLGFEGADMRLVAERLDALESQRGAPGVEPLIDVMRVYPFYGDIGRAVRDGWTAWERCPHSDALTAQFGMVLWFGGHGDRVHDILEPALTEIKDPTARSWALATLAFLAVDEDEPELAERYGRQAVDAAESHGGRDRIDSQYAFTALAEALRRQGALDEAGEHLAHAARITSKQPNSVYHAFTLVFEAQLALTRRDRASARAGAAAARTIIDRYPDVGTLTDRLAHVEAALQQRSDDDLQDTKPSPAELRVLTMLPSELTMDQIAKQLYLSVHTVGAHRRRLYRRLGATSRQHAVTIARERGLL